MFYPENIHKSKNSLPCFSVEFFKRHKHFIVAFNALRFRLTIILIIVVTIIFIISHMEEITLIKLQREIK